MTLYAVTAFFTTRAPNWNAAAQIIADRLAGVADLDPAIKSVEEVDTTDRYNNGQFCVPSMGRDDDDQFSVHAEIVIETDNPDDADELVERHFAAIEGFSGDATTNYRFTDAEPPRQTTWVRTHADTRPDDHAALCVEG